MKKVLVIEDLRGVQSEYARQLNGFATIISAFTVEEGERLFLENPDIDAIVMDACVPGDSITTIPLVQKIRETFSGPMIAASGSEFYRKDLMTAGCNYQSRKQNVPEMVIGILGL